MPLSAPAYTSPPFWAMPGGRLLFVFFQADIEAMRFEVPTPLVLHHQNTAFAWIGDLIQSPHTMTPYHESLIAVKVRYKTHDGWYLPYLWTSNDESTIFARELYGWPSQLSDNDPIQIEGSQIQAMCRRRGELLMRISLNITSPPPQSRQKSLEDRFNKLIAGDWLQVRKIPSPEKNGKPLKQLLHIATTDFKLHEIWEGNAVLEIGASGYYPNLHRLQPRKILGAFYTKPEWLVPHAKIIWQKK